MVVYIVVSVALRGYFPAARPNLKMEIHSCHMLTSVLSLLLPSPACRIFFYFIMLSHFFFLILIRRKSNKEIGLGEGNSFQIGGEKKRKKEILFTHRKKKKYIGTVLCVSTRPIPPLPDSYTFSTQSSSIFHIRSNP